MYNILQILTSASLYPRGIPNIIVDPTAPDPPPDVFVQGNFQVEAIQAIASGMNVDAAQLAKQAGASLRSVGS